jgi:hypothetical protein
MSDVSDENLICSMQQIRDHLRMKHEKPTMIQAVEEEKADG